MLRRIKGIASDLSILPSSCLFLSKLANSMVREGGWGSCYKFFLLIFWDLVLTELEMRIPSHRIMRNKWDNATKALSRVPGILNLFHCFNRNSSISRETGFPILRHPHRVPTIPYQFWLCIALSNHREETLLVRNTNFLPWHQNTQMKLRSLEDSIIFRLL